MVTCKTTFLQFCHFFFIYYQIFYCKQEFPLPSSTMGSWILFYSKCYNPLFSIFFLMLKLSQIWPMRITSSCLVYSFKFLSNCLFLMCQHHKVSKTFQAHLVVHLPQSQSLPQGDLVPFGGEWYLEIKLWVIGVLTSTRISLNLGPVSGQSQEIYLFFNNEFI